MTNSIGEDERLFSEAPNLTLLFFNFKGIHCVHLSLKLNLSSTPTSHHWKKKKKKKKKEGKFIAA